MRLRQVLPAALLPLAVYAQSSATAAGTGTAATAEQPISTGSATGGTPRGDLAQTTNLTYISYQSTITRSGTAVLTTGPSNATANGTLTSTSSPSFLSNTATRTSVTRTDAPAPTNTQPCNGYLEFCERSYSNITYVAAHNFPFLHR